MPLKPLLKEIRVYFLRISVPYLQLEGCKCKSITFLSSFIVNLLWSWLSLSGCRLSPPSLSSAWYRITHTRVREELNVFPAAVTYFHSLSCFHLAYRNERRSISESDSLFSEGSLALSKAFLSAWRKAMYHDDHDCPVLWWRKPQSCSTAITATWPSPKHMIRELIFRPSFVLLHGIGLWTVLLSHRFFLTPASRPHRTSVQWVSGLLPWGKAARTGNRPLSA